MSSYTETRINKQDLLPNLAELYVEMEKEQDTQQAKKVRDLAQKLQKKELIIGFAGHFSAGKSTMINELVGEDILPSSPIPTSANVVKVKNGNQYVRIFYKDKAVQYNKPFDKDTIKALSKDGETVKAIEISKSISSLPKHVAIMDTPGIDSSNDADRIMTEANLHVVDVLFYVMDYNHVQSEVNLSFLREMQARGKTFYIVINQIDKHQEQELSFQAFQESVKSVLTNWGIKPDDIYYTSLRNQTHPYNEFNQVRQCFNEYASKIEGMVEQTVKHSMKTIIKDHIAYLTDLEQSTIDTLTDQLEQLTIGEEEADVLKDERDAEQSYRESLDGILKNAYLMPYENRELAKDFIESQQRDFKAGMLFAKKKTAQVKEERLNNFYTSLLETASRQMEMHLRDLLMKFVKEYRISDEGLMQQIQNFTVSYEKEQLLSIVKPGAEVTGNYVLVFTEEVSADIKKYVKEATFPIWDRIFAFIKQEADKKKQKRNALQEQQAQVSILKQKRDSIYDRLENRNTILIRILKGKSESNTNYVDQINVAIQNELAKVEPIEHLSANVVQNEEKQETTSRSKEKTVSINVDKTIEILDNTVRLISKVKGFSTLSEDLQKKSKRLKNRHFTVALFGAFSAGKSSFANALLGDAILPVSPNPTTATINKISPPTEENPHGTVVVQFKKESQLLQDVELIIREQKQTFNSLGELIKWLHATDLSKVVDEEGTKNLSFLQALVLGYDNVKDQIGQQISIPLEEAKAFIAEERFACYVEWMETFYQCAFTDQSITLVDTPGADSVNARHTDVAFEYIKDADAILFVTYYNHAFSRADREFLIQLGRVKDVFSLDKMFFIINAADLAKDEQELQLVRTYVEEQLSQYGIRSPRMFALSSKRAIEEKKGNVTDKASGISTFEEKFSAFIDKDLTYLFVQSAFHDLKRVTTMLRKYINSASLDKAEKENIKGKYEQDQQHLASIIDQYGTDRMEQSIKQEIEELIYYIHQRLFFRFSDFFKESINPSTIKSNGKKGKIEVQHAFTELLAYLNHDLIQELQATSLRIENFIKKSIVDWVQEVERKDEMQAYDFSFSDDFEVVLESPQVSVDLQATNDGKYDKALSLFKNTKSFFESNEKEQMKDAIEKLLKPIVKNILTNKEQELVAFFLPQCQNEQRRVKEKMKKSVFEYFDGLLYNVSDNVNIEQLKYIYEQIKEQADI
ncbi:dynamin family protein [Salirhabdus sp. Marseille-P4669]|uniref:dynamin family protein n=1 Tax=Salirhabdus sp. Marseille-P4669 TaxID=2042310 RepID=UPI000C7C678C|nr:dynamin family protein [Salirhabdus sp. Marseille-P4669]